MAFIGLNKKKKGQMPIVFQPVRSPSECALSSASFMAFRCNTVTIDIKPFAKAKVCTYRYAFRIGASDSTSLFKQISKRCETLTQSKSFTKNTRLVARRVHPSKYACKGGGGPGGRCNSPFKQNTFFCEPVNIGACHSMVSVTAQSIRSKCIQRYENYVQRWMRDIRDITKYYRISPQRKCEFILRIFCYGTVFCLKY